MMWDVTMLLVHLVLAWAAVFLYRQAPCWMQKLVMSGFATAMLVCAVSFVFALCGMPEARWPVFFLGLLLGHITSMVYLFRLLFQGHIQWTQSFPRSPSSPG